MSTTTAAKKATAPRKAAPAKPASSKSATRAKAPAKRAASKRSGLAEAAASGNVKFYRQRASKTLRNLPYFAPGTDTRKAAEAVQKRWANGDTIGAIAEDLNASVATVRRMITGLLLAQEIEAGEYDKAWDGSEGRRSS